MLNQTGKDEVEGKKWLSWCFLNETTRWSGEGEWTRSEKSGSERRRERVETMSIGRREEADRKEGRSVSKQLWGKRERKTPDT